ncbi:MAG: hypothetical protein WAL52_21585 [Candidatus Sulfotelmatobacter sp.]
MVGTDGILLASDTRWTYTPRLRSNELWAGGRYTGSAEKIIVSHERNLAVTCARNMEVARRMASAIVAGLPDEQLAHPMAALENIGNDVLSSCEERRNEAQCLIAFTKPTLQLFILQFGTLNGTYRAVAQRFGDYCFAGDNFTPSLFWIERYYNKRVPLPIEQLAPLAAHFIIATSKLTTMVSGLEMVFCRPSGISRLSDESIQRLEAQAHKWDEEFGNTVLTHTQQFTYAPNVIV